MYNRILVAVDGSETSNVALQEAIRLAKDHDSQVRLLHIVDLPGMNLSIHTAPDVRPLPWTMAYSAVEAPYIFESRKAMEEAGKRVLAECSMSAHSAGVQFDSKCVVMFGRHIYDVIEEEATQWPADLIVIGTHGRRGIRRLLLGSVAEGLTRVSSKPILLIRGT